MDYAPLVVIVGLLLVMVFFSNRNKQKRAVEDANRRQAMVAGTSVMTTSGMYGVIVAVDADNDGGPADTVVLEIAPGTQVTWALAAVREAPTRVAPPARPASDPVTDPTDLTPTAESTGVRMVKPKGRGADN